LSLHQIERACNIRWEFLQAIEQENFSYMPRHELRRAIKVYAEFLGLSPRDLFSRPAQAPPAARTSHFAIFMTLMVVLVAVGLYLL